MIQKLEIQGQHLEVTEKLHKYVVQKIGKLDTFAPRASRESIHAEVTLKATTVNKQEVFTASVALHMPHKTLDASDTTINIFAAVDIVEEKLRAQLKKYKEVTAGGQKRQLFVRAKLRMSKIKSKVAE